MILLLTGQPGHGKTAYAIFRALKLVEEGRLVYAHGIKDLNYESTGFKQLEDPTKWEDLPDGSVVLIDECYSTFPSRAPGKAVPGHVDAMARHRHRGFDFILIAQQGLQLDSFLRGLVEEHIHVRRKFGTKATKLKRWTHYQNNVNGPCADADDWIRPSHVFKHYTSTVVDTTKLHIPRWIRLIALTLAILAVLGYALVHGLKSKYTEAKEAAASVSGAAGTGRGTRTGAGGLLTPMATADEYLALMRPRVESIPASAPLYDGRAVKQYPRAYCIASGHDGRDGCSCFTQQATRVQMHPDACRKLAREGGEFDPFAEPLQERPERDRARPTVLADDVATTSHNGGLRPPEAGVPDPVQVARLAQGGVATGTGRTLPTGP